MARSKFQEFIVWRQNLNVPGLAPFSQFEKIKGEMALKIWENNLEESKRLAKEVKDACLDVLSAVDLEMTKIDVSSIHATLGQVEIEKSKEDLKKNKESVQNGIL
jgi:hypothetical protein